MFKLRYWHTSWTMYSTLSRDFCVLYSHPYPSQGTFFSSLRPSHPWASSGSTQWNRLVVTLMLSPGARALDTRFAHFFFPPILGVGFTLKRIWVFTCCLCVDHMCSACGSQKRAAEPLELELQMSLCGCWGPNTSLRKSNSSSESLDHLFATSVFWRHHSMHKF